MRIVVDLMHSGDLHQYLVTLKDIVKYVRDTTHDQFVCHCQVLVCLFVITQNLTNYFTGITLKIV